jgi:hypothetical protein
MCFSTQRRKKESMDPDIRPDIEHQWVGDILDLDGFHDEAVE